jgi:hypothetical protein
VTPHLPPGVGYYPVSANGVFGTYNFHLLPYLEQDNLFQSALGTVPFPDGPTVVYYPGNRDVFAQKVAVFLCPSDPSVGPSGLVTINGVPFGATCYVANGLVAGQTAPPGPQGQTRLEEIDNADGLSNTILHAEKYARCSNTNMLPPFRDGGTAWAYSAALPFPWQRPPMDLPPRAFQPGFAIAGLANLGAPGAIGPGSIFQVQPREGRCDPTRASTAHPGGIQVGLADGSVHTLSRGVSGDTWWAAVTPAGGEVLGSDW